MVGNLFRYELQANARSELLIIMTPHVVRNEEDAERIKKVEAARIHWCLSDVIEAHGEAGLRTRRDEWSDAEVPVIYPDAKPGANAVPHGGKPGATETIPTPAPAHTSPTTSPAAPGPAAPSGAVLPPAAEPARAVGDTPADAAVTKASAELPLVPPAQAPASPPPLHNPLRGS